MAGTKPSESPSTRVQTHPGDIADIARRLDELLRTMAEVPDPVPASRSVSGAKLDAARRAWRARRERERIFGLALFADPAWDILLDIFIAREEGRKISVFTLCQETAVPEETVLRCVANLIEAKLVMRQPPEPQSVELALSDRGLEMMCDYFSRTMSDRDGGAA